MNAESKRRIEAFVSEASAAVKECIPIYERIRDSVHDPDELRELAKTLPHPHWMAGLFVSESTTRKRDLTSALRLAYADAALMLARRSGYRFGNVEAHLARAEALARLGEAQKARSAMRTSRRYDEHDAGRAHRLWILALLAEQRGNRIYANRLLRQVRRLNDELMAHPAMRSLAGLRTDAISAAIATEAARASVAAHGEVKVKKIA